MMMYAAIVGCALAFTACNKSNDNQSGQQEQKDATPVYVQLNFTLEEPQDMVDNMDITVTFNNGTEKVSEKMTSTTLVKAINSTLPANFTINSTIRLKSGVTLSDDVKYTYTGGFSATYTLLNAAKEEINTARLSSASNTQSNKGSVVTMLANNGTLDAEFIYSFDKSGKPILY